MANIKIDSYAVRNNLARDLAVPCARRFDHARRTPPLDADTLQRLLVCQNDLDMLNHLKPRGLAPMKNSTIQISLPEGQYAELAGFSFTFHCSTGLWAGAFPLALIDPVSEALATWLYQRWLEWRRWQFAVLVAEQVAGAANDSTQLGLMCLGAGKLLDGPWGRAINDPSRLARLRVLPSWCYGSTVVRNRHDTDFITVDHSTMLKRFNTLLAEATLFSPPSRDNRPPPLQLTAVVGRNNRTIEFNWLTLGDDLWGDK